MPEKIWQGVLFLGFNQPRDAAHDFFPDSVVQQCLVHKERNIRSKLSTKYWSELARLFKRLRSVQGKQAAEEVVKELEEFLQGKNQEHGSSQEPARSRRRPGRVTVTQCIQHAPSELTEHQRN